MMNYVGFLCLGVGILSLVIGMICALVSMVSHEAIIKTKAKRVAIPVLLLAFVLLTIGLNMTFSILFPTN